MNRTAAKVAKILDADVLQVKRWTFDFKSFLSSTANPTKGKVRMFNDADLLVLMYVCHHWEEEPDVECIKVGLNQGEHREDAYVEHLYLHSPLIQDPPDDLDETWRHGILLVGGGRYEYLELARSYRHVAESMLRTALEKNEVDGWAYPVLFAYRHTLELYLKLIGEIDEITHSLARCVQLVEQRRKVTLPPPIREWILQLEQIDPAGTAFRYVDDDMGCSRYFEHWFDFRHFQFAMRRVFDALDMAILRTGAKGKPVRKKK
ncbi:MAG: hypothetical protein IPL39_13465 [Opitutaceae bacterium]|nr:hypothetical protein [Opitutaceae bacterium]